MRVPTLALIGFRGVGKTTLGSHLAQKTNVSFQDSDALLAARLPCDLPSFAERFGLEEFRKQEAHVIAEMLDTESFSDPPRLLAFGGGFVDSPTTYDLLQKSREQKRLRCVYLCAPEEFLVQRNLLLQAQGFKRAGPWAESTELSHLYQKRGPLFEALADLKIETTLNLKESKTLEKISEEILTWWNLDRRAACDQ